MPDLLTCLPQHFCFQLTWSWSRRPASAPRRPASTSTSAVVDVLKRNKNYQHYYTCSPPPTFHYTYSLLVLLLPLLVLGLLLMPVVLLATAVVELPPLSLLYLQKIQIETFVASRQLITVLTASDPTTHCPASAAASRRPTSAAAIVELAEKT